MDEDEYLRANGYPRRAGYMHVPLLPEQVVQMKTDMGIPPSMSLDLMVKAVVIALKTTVERFETGDEKLPP
ncbi:hypothetical protein [Desulfurococcus mucosus]|uniref:pyroglutamyl-peptidase I family protein n=1 Tax=Desulfurococcus mucosus TaxID=2275 RepID=UPI0023B7F72A|nr:hypothetical protein [Desulfurococcus mucosus]